MIQPLFLLLIVGLPLAAFLINGLVVRPYFKELAGPIGVLAMLGSFFFALNTAWVYFGSGAALPEYFSTLTPIKMDWLNFGHGLSIQLGVQLDPLSVLMLVVVTFISLLVNIYSLGYMQDEPRKATYFSFLGLFTFSMLGLVMAPNILQLYIFWELVGVSSFLLISFYYEKRSAAAAAKKAFIVTRFADLGLLIGVLILSNISHTFDFTTMIERLNDPHFSTAAIGSFMGLSIVTWGLALVFIGGAGKSAMFPLHIWLPDAMEGPTPVSALIHAATMVVAGVFLLARLFPLFGPLAPHLLTGIGYIGVGTSFIAAIIACTQTDIKRVLAYSTISQIGFMIFAIGVARPGVEESLGYTASLFHLFTHALFKAMLFLCAGSIIHYVHSNELSAMGGLRKKMPITHLSFLIGCLAIAGVPPLSGFFSKEEILLAAFNGNKIIYWMGLITAGLTSFYMFRLYFSIFWNKEFMAVSHQEHGPSTILEKGNGHNGKENEGIEHHTEGTATMKLPLVILAVFTSVVGFIPFGNLFAADNGHLESSFHLLFSIAPVALSLLGIGIAIGLYKNQNGKSDQIAQQLSGLYQAAKNKFYIDELYLFVTKKIIFNLIGRPAAWFDKTIIDGSMNGMGNITSLVSSRIKGLQSGQVQDYSLYFYLGMSGLAFLLMYLWI